MLLHELAAITWITKNFIYKIILSAKVVG